MDNERKKHWEYVYETKQPNEVSWTQVKPTTSLLFIDSFNLPKSAKIIDVGGGDSLLADYLLDEGYEDITVLDISEKALERARLRLGARADKIKWIVTDVTAFQPEEQYDVWHDRAAFHFLTSNEQKRDYANIVNYAVKGYLVIGTFSDKGPKKCSGLDICQYNEATLASQFKDRFSVIDCITEDHITPFNTRQHFIFCSFKRQ